MPKTKHTRRDEDIKRCHRFAWEEKVIFVKYKHAGRLCHVDLIFIGRF